MSIASFPNMMLAVFDEARQEKDLQIRVPRTDADLSEFAAVEQESGIGVTGLVMRADREALARAPGWRILVGAFVIDGELKNCALAPFAGRSRTL